MGPNATTASTGKAMAAQVQSGEKVLSDHQAAKAKVHFRKNHRRRQVSATEVPIPGVVLVENSQIIKEYKFTI